MKIKTLKSKRPCGAGSLLGLCLSGLLVTGNAIAQTNSQWYQFDKDVKGYSTEVIPGSAMNRESVMAGTVFDNNGLGKIHFLRLDEGPGGADFPGILASQSYNDPVFFDERAVDVAVKTNEPNRFFITALSRMDPTATPNPTILYSDRIKVLLVDGAGSVMNETVIWENSITPSASQHWGYGMYPRHSIFKPNVWDPVNMMFKDLLYICGYVTLQNTTNPLVPDYLTSKEIFVLTVDVTNPTWTVAKTMFYDGPVPSTTHSPELDYDMAMYMQEITTGTYAGDIFVTGSITEKTGIYNGPPWPYTCVRSATLSLQIDAWDLGTTSGIVDNSFLDLGNGDGYGMNEYGIGMIESPNLSNARYIVSNRYDLGSSCSGIPANKWVNPYSYNDEVHGFYITHADASFTPTTQRLWYTQGYAQNLLIPGSLNPPSGSNDEARVLITGFTRYNLPFCTQSQFYNKANMMPFILDADLEVASGVVQQFGPATTAPLKTYPNQTGTGDPSLVTNAYANLGGGLSNVMFNNTMASRDNNTSEIMMSVPKWDNNTNRLGIKTMFLDANSFDFSSNANCVVDNCYSDILTPDIEPAVGEIRGHFLVNTISSSVPVYENFTNGGECKNGVYKTGTTGIAAKTARAVKTSVFPNPASKNIEVRLANDVNDDSKITVVLSSIYGQKIATLYQGSAAGLTQNSKLALPQVSPGIYMVQISGDGQVLLNTRLVVNQ